MEERSELRRFLQGARMRRTVAACMVSVTLGCHSLPVTVQNPAAVGHPSYDYVWETTIEVLEKYFDVAYENRWSGWIETKPQSAATLLEVWRPDSVDIAERLESTLQTVRRRAYVHLQPGATGGFVITVEVYKELEDLPQPIGTRFGGGSFISSIEPTREEIVSSPIKPSQGWISLGRDLKLEARILDEIQRRVDGAAPL
jgi:hypothetical protein